MKKDCDRLKAYILNSTAITKKLKKRYDKQTRSGDKNELRKMSHWFKWKQKTRTRLKKTTTADVTSNKQPARLIRRALVYPSAFFPPEPAVILRLERVILSEPLPPSSAPSHSVYYFWRCRSTFCFDPLTHSHRTCQALKNLYKRLLIVSKADQSQACYLKISQCRAASSAKHHLRNKPPCPHSSLRWAPAPHQRATTYLFPGWNGILNMRWF